MKIVINIQNHITYFQMSYQDKDRTLNDDCISALFKFLIFTIEINQLKVVNLWCKIYERHCLLLWRLIYFLFFYFDVCVV